MMDLVKPRVCRDLEVDIASYFDSDKERRVAT